MHLGCAPFCWDILTNHILPLKKKKERKKSEGKIESPLIQHYMYFTLSLLFPYTFLFLRYYNTRIRMPTPN